MPTICHAAMMHRQATIRSGQLPVWIPCNVESQISNLYLDLLGFAFQTSISLGAAARDYYQADSETRQTPVPGYLY